MDPKITKKTQDTLGKIIKKPPLTDKLLGKPPFRFLHDVVTSVIKATGFMKGLYTEAEMNSENVKEKEGKVAFLQKAVDMVAAVTGKNLAVKPVKIVAGHEPENTNEFLQALATAINAKVDNDEFVKKVLSGGGGGGGGKEEKKDRDKDRARSASRRKEGEEKHRKEDKERSREQDKERSRSERHKDRESEEGEKEKEHHRDRDRDKREKSRDREDRHRDKDRDKDKERDKDKRKKHKEEKENESPEQNGEKESSQETPSRLQRPTSAKGARRRRQGREARDEEDEEFQQRAAGDNGPAIGEDDLPPQIAAVRKMARPSSARPAPPRPKQEGVEAEPAMRLGAGAPTNLIVDNEKASDDEDENFLVEESAPPPPSSEPASSHAEPEDDAEHGALVKKMLESKKEAEQQQQQPTKKTEIERPAMSDAQRRKQRELVAKEIERLQSSIQSLTRSANPLGKIMDYVQEDLDSMQKELDRWRTENKEHALALRRERNVTDRAIEPLKAQLADLDRAITDQLDLIAATKSNILRNDQKAGKMLLSLAKS